MNYEPLVTGLGFSQKGAQFYIAALRLSQGTVLSISREAGLSRTSAYYVVLELLTRGALEEVRIGKKTYYQPIAPDRLLADARDRVAEVENVVPELRALIGTRTRGAKVKVLYGVAGFKQLWDNLLSKPRQEYSLITSGTNFLDFTSERYILANIIARKKKSGITSKQLIVDSEYARKIVAKDVAENRTSKLIPKNCKLQFTELITKDWVAFVSPRAENLIVYIESSDFAATRHSLFNLLWQLLPEKK